MNTPITINKIKVTEIDTPTPKSLTITPRDRRFGRDNEQKQRRWWLNDDPVATAFYNAFSVSFPRGEAFFVESVKAFRDGAPPRLAEEIRQFTMQEVMHSREHVSFNQRVVDNGYDLTKLDERIDASHRKHSSRPAIIKLASTMALEHFTAMFSREMLVHPKHMAGADTEAANLWYWHSIEEIEHKAVAYDTWLYATRDWSPLKRWSIKSATMLLVTINFIPARWNGMMELLRQDGFTGFKTHCKLFWYAFGNPGLFRRVFGAWVAYFLPGFHPWNVDERELINRVESAVT